MSLRTRIIDLVEWQEMLAEVAQGGERDKHYFWVAFGGFHTARCEGYQEAAEVFQAESGTSLQGGGESLKARTAIRQAVQAGDVEQAIDKTNDYDPEVLDDRPKLYFELQKQRLIELIRKGDVPGALGFAQEELATRARSDPKFLPDLEKAMALLAFEKPVEESPDAYLLQPAERQRTATSLNKAILESELKEQEATLKRLLQRLSWAQHKLSSKQVHYPLLTNFETGELYTEHLPKLNHLEDYSEDEDKDENDINDDDDFMQY